MSLREEEREKNNCPSRGLGLGLAAAAIGVGVGAALYYFINKREEPTSEGSTTQNWTCNSPQTLNQDNSDNSYTTISENSTTDTSMNEDSFSCKMHSDDSETETSDDSESESMNSDSESESMDSDSDLSELFDNNSNRSQISMHSSPYSDATDFSDWDVTASLEYPSFEPARYTVRDFARNLISSSHKNKSRERSWTLEECSICFDVILRDQEVMSLPCTHNFHSKCILPWLQEQQTCPNCRKSID